MSHFRLCIVRLDVAETEIDGYRHLAVCALKKMFSAAGFYQSGIL